MDNFDLRKYLAEGKLQEENGIRYAVILKEMDFATEDEDGYLGRHDDIGVYTLSVGEIDEDENILDEWETDMVVTSKEDQDRAENLLDIADGDHELEAQIEEILSIHKDRESAEKEHRRVGKEEYFYV